MRRGQFALADRIVDTRLAEQLGISRTPVREALKRLCHEGVLAQTSRGYVMHVMTAPQIRDFSELRMALEPVIITHSAKCIDEKGKRELRSHLANAEAALDQQDPADFMIAMDCFRECWVARCANQALVGVMTQYQDQLMLSRYATIKNLRMRRIAFDSMAEIASALDDNDVERSRRAAMDYIQKGGDCLLEAIENEHLALVS